MSESKTSVDAPDAPTLQPGRLIWNLETPDVQGEFERRRAAGALVVQVPYQPDEDPEGWIATFARRLDDRDDQHRHGPVGL